MRENCLLIIAGPSAIGKTTVAYKMIERDARYEFVRSVTTRPKRGDAYDAEYIYISTDEFRELISNGGVLEHTEYAGNYYGTPRSEVKRILAEGNIPLLVLDINGVENLVKSAGDDFSACGVYIYDSLNVAEQRLYDRFLGDNPTPEGLSKFVGRKEKNLSDFLTLPDHCAAFFDFIHNSGTVDDATDSVVRSFRRFCEGDERDGERISSIALELSESAKEKVK